VVDAAGKPVNDAFISAARESDAAGSTHSSVEATRWGDWDSDSVPVLTSTDGTFAVTKLAPGSYSLRAYRKGGGEAVAEHVAVGTTTRLQIKPPDRSTAPPRATAAPSPTSSRSRSRI
jgi:hypothetical protein